MKMKAREARGRFYLQRGQKGIFKRYIPSQRHDPAPALLQGYRDPDRAAREARLVSKEHVRQAIGRQGAYRPFLGAHQPIYRGREDPMVETIHRIGVRGVLLV